MHVFIVLILPAYKWLPPFAADVLNKNNRKYSLKNGENTKT